MILKSAENAILRGRAGRYRRKNIGFSLVGDFTIRIIRDVERPLNVKRIARDRDSAKMRGDRKENDSTRYELRYGSSRVVPGETLHPMTRHFAYAFPKVFPRPESAYYVAGFARRRACEAAGVPLGIGPVEPRSVRGRRRSAEENREKAGAREERRVPSLPRFSQTVLLTSRLLLLLLLLLYL